MMVCACVCVRAYSLACVCGCVRVRCKVCYGAYVRRAERAVAGLKCVFWIRCLDREGGTVVAGMCGEVGRAVRPRRLLRGLSNLRDGSLR